MIDAVLLNDTRIDAHHGCDAVVAAIQNLCAANGIRLIGMSPAHQDWRGNSAVLAKMAAASLILVNGEGTLHHDRPAGHALLSAGGWAQERGKTSALINTTWHANGDEAYVMVRNFDIVSVRESASLAELSARGIKASKMPDLASFAAAGPASTRESHAVSDSVHGTQSVELYKAIRPYAARRLPIKKLSSNPVTAGRWVRRHVASKAALLSPPALVSAIRAALPDLSHQAADLDELLERLGGFELMVTGRFHMMIFCLVTGTPFIALRSNTHKIEATAADAGVNAWRVIDRPSAINEALLRKASHWHEGEAESIEQYLLLGRERIEVLFGQIAHLART